MDFLYNIFQFIKELFLSPKLLFSVFLFCLACLLLPESYQNKLGLKELIDQYRTYFGLFLLFSSIILVIELIIWIVSICSNAYKKREQKKIFFNRLKSLSEEERKILEACIAKKQQGFVRIATDSAAQALCQKGIAKISDEGHIMSMPFLIDDDIWNFINKKANPFEDSDSK